MKRGTHLMAPGPVGVKGRFVREIMLLLDGFNPVMSGTKLSSLCKCLASTKFGSMVAMWLPARVVARSLTQTTASTKTMSLCVESLTAGRVFATSLCGARTTIEEIIFKLNVWGEEAVFGQLQEEGRYPLPSQMKIYCVVFNKWVCKMSIYFYILSQDFWSNLIIKVAINNHIILLLYEEMFIFEIPVWRKMLSVTPATNILIIQSWGKT